MFWSWSNVHRDVHDLIEADRVKLYSERVLRSREQVMIEADHVKLRSERVFRSRERVMIEADHVKLSSERVLLSRTQLGMSSCVHLFFGGSPQYKLSYFFGGPYSMESTLPSWIS